MHEKHLLVLPRHGQMAMPDARASQTGRARGPDGRPRELGWRPRPAHRRLIDGYRLTWLVAIAAALGSGFTVHRMLHEEEDGPSPAVILSALGLVGGNIPTDTTPQSDAPSGEAQQTRFLVRSTLMALDDANRSGNYTVLRDLAGPRFQARNSALRLRQVFEAFREAGVDLSHASMVEPRVDKRVVNDDAGVLAVEGHVPSPAPGSRHQVRYAMEFEPVQGHWRLLTLSVGIEPASRSRRAN